MNIAHVDFETFSELDVRNVGGCRYAEHPSTELICLGWAIGGEDPELWTPEDYSPRRLFRHIRQGGILCAWNVGFEIPVWEKVAVPLGWPRVPLRQWRDSEALALTYALPPSLELAGAALGLDIVKDRRGHHLIHKLCKPRKPSKNNPATRWTPENAPQDFADFYEYCRQDVRSERAIHEALPRDDLPARELNTWFMTVKMNLRGWTVDTETVRKMIELLGEHETEALTELRAVTKGEIKTSGQRDKILAWMKRRGLSLPDWTAGTITEALKLELPADVRRVLELRQELGKSSVKKYSAMIARACQDGKVRNNLMYHGAGTGRDAGRGLQIQNLPRASVAKTQEGVAEAIDVMDHGFDVVRMFFGSVPHFASSLTRSMLTASPGHKLYCGDFSSIENRVTVWAAGSEYGMQIFRDGLDEYKTFAVNYYGVAYDDVTDDQRSHAKRAVLLCCFGGGWQALQNQAAQFSADGVGISEEVARKTINTYRRELYPEVPEMWYALDAAAKRAIERGRPSKVTTSTTTIRFYVKDGFLFMVLPSRRRLAYYAPKIEDKRTPWGEMKPTITHMGVDSKTHKWVRQKLIPGRIFENVVQAASRDLMMIGAHSTIGAGYDLIGRVHDELVSERADGEGDLSEYLTKMCPPVPWIQGIPVEATGWVGHRYRKD